MAFNGEGEFHFEGKEGNVVSSNKAEMHCINFFQKLHGTLYFQKLLRAVPSEQVFCHQEENQMCLLSCVEQTSDTFQLEAESKGREEVSRQVIQVL